MAPLTPIQVAPAIVLRISGDVTPISKFFSATPKHRVATFCRYQSERNPLITDDILLTYFKAPNSYTGEDVLEISFHGNPLIVNTAMADFADNGVRLADRGEFTQRAFINGKLTLAQSEGVNALIHSHTAAGVHAAANTLHGGLDAIFSHVRSSLVELLAKLEAAIDFSEELYELDSSHSVEPIVKALTDLLANYHQAQRALHGVKVVIAGAPNAGKSTLFNILLSQDRAIVSDEAGTTRDTLSEQAHSGGVTFALTDTAGVRETSSQSEAAGVKRAVSAIESADLLLIIIDLSTPLSSDSGALLHNTVARERIIIGNKSDMPKVAEVDTDVQISSKALIGIEELKDLITAKVQKLLPAQIELSLTSESQRLDCETALHELKTIQAEDLPLDLQAYHIRAALRSLDSLQGSDITEETLTKLFSSFCIGK